MALVHDSIAQDREPQIVSIIGDSNVGKTVYLGFLLDMLTQRAGDFEAIPKGAYSIDLQQTVISHMARRVFPPKTPMEANQWYWAYYQVCQAAPQPKWVDLVMPDIAGESLAAEVAAPNTFQVIRSLLNKSAGMMLLVDAALAANGSSQPDFFALKMLSYIDTMYGTGRDQRVNTPIADRALQGRPLPGVLRRSAEVRQGQPQPPVEPVPEPVRQRRVLRLQRRRLARLRHRTAGGLRDPGPAAHRPAGRARAVPMGRRPVVIAFARR